MALCRRILEAKVRLAAAGCPELAIAIIEKQGG
jgi:hypothetical protein